VIGKMARGGPVGVVLRWASSLRFPVAFGLMVVLFILDLLIPDLIPFVDEVIFGLVAILLGKLRKKPNTESVVDKEDE
jgi:hypothetical protein